MQPHSEPKSAKTVEHEAARESLLARLFKLRVGAMLVRNTAVSTAVFGLGLVCLWALVELAGVGEVIASGVSFVLANTLHYTAARSWIFRGTDRKVVSGYALFVLNGLFGLVITMTGMAVLLEYTPINYLLARILVSVIAGLTMFVINAVWNFRRV